jgi:hypothetical protein
VPPPEARIADIAACLTALGLTPTLKRYPDQTVIEAQVPSAFPASRWPELLALLERADSFSFVDSTARGRSLSAAIDKNNVAPMDATNQPPGGQT